MTPPGSSAPVSSGLATTTAAVGAGMLGSVDGPWANDTIAYTYDELGRQIGRTVNATAAVSATFDALGRVTGVTNPLGSFTYAYSGVSGRMTSLTTPIGSTTFAYLGATGARRLSEIKNLDGSNAVISQFNYTCTAGGNIATWTQNHSGLSHPRVYNLGYDAIDQLTTGLLKDTVSNAVLRDQAYRYDLAQNRITTQDGNLLATETANNLNQITAVAGGGMMRFAGSINETATLTIGGNAAKVKADLSFEGYAAVANNTTTRVPIVATDLSNNVTSKYVDIAAGSVSGKSFTYDNNGNTLTGTDTYTWDAANRLVSIAKGGNTYSFDYDGAGRRVKEKLNGTEIRHWVWDGLELCEERDNTNSVTKRFYGQGEQISGSSYYFNTDHLGSVREMSNAAGVLKARYDYDLYGARSENLVTSGAVEADFGFTGHYFHTSSGLHLAPYRAYDSSSARWLSRDPIAEEGGINLYGYVLNSPPNAIDRDGLDLLIINHMGHRYLGIDNPTDPAKVIIYEFYPDDSPRNGKPPGPLGVFGQPGKWDRKVMSEQPPIYPGIDFVHKTSHEFDKKLVALLDSKFKVQGDTYSLQGKECYNAINDAISDIKPTYGKESFGLVLNYKLSQFFKWFWK